MVSSTAMDFIELKIQGCDPTAPPDRVPYEGDNILLQHMADRRMANISLRNLDYRSWSRFDAFREFVLQWRDAIITSYCIEEGYFTVIHEVNRTGDDVEIVYKVPIPNVEPPAWAGYVRYVKKGRSGVIEIVNKEACLQAGTWEPYFTLVFDQRALQRNGLHTAIHRLLQEPDGHAVRCIARGLACRFSVSRAFLALSVEARVRRMEAEQIVNIREESEKQLGNTLLPFPPDPAVDLQFVIGETTRPSRRGDAAAHHNLAAVTAEDFQTWCARLLVFNDVQNCTRVPSEYGDLLLEPSLRGRLYCDGVLLDGWALPLRYGYNIRKNRSNSRLSTQQNSYQEGRAIMAIWNDVLDWHPDYTSELHDMLNDRETDPADVFYARDFISAGTLRHLRDFLFETSERS